MKKLFLSMVLLSIQLLVCVCNAQTTWKVDSDFEVASGTSVTSVEGITLNIGNVNDGNTWRIRDAAVNLGEGNTVLGTTKFITGNTNPKTGSYNTQEGQVPETGTYYQFVLTESGLLTVGVVLNTGKTMRLADTDGTIIYEEENFTGDSILETRDFILSAGTYYLYAQGTKLGLFGFSFSTGENVPRYIDTSDGLRFFIIPQEGVAELVYSPNYHNSLLGAISIPDNFTYNGVNYTVSSIGESALYGCSGLTSITIPNSVTSIRNNAFNGCFCLTSITIPNSVISIENSAFSGCSGLTSLTIPNSVTSIENRVFSGCSGLTSITIPHSVTSIGEGAFSGCSGLTSITIPNSVTSIGHNAFSECSNIKEVYCYAEDLPNTENDIFLDSYPQKATLYVPSASLSFYENTAPWNLFGTKKAISGTGDESIKCATPTISYANKELTFSCETEGVEFVSKITDTDIKDFYSDKISLTATYNISVYATKSGYTNSDVATATLVWTDAIFTETTETPTSAKAVQESIPVLISAKGGNISVRCEADGQEVNVYTIDGLSLGTATVKNGEALIGTSIPSGDIAVVKVGGRSVKVIMR